MQFPRLLVVRQNFPDRRIPDVAAEVHKQLSGSGFAARLKPGARVAIGVGSRGINNIAKIAHATVQCMELLSRGVPGIHFYTLNRSDATRVIFDSLGIPRRNSEPAPAV